MAKKGRVVLEDAKSALKTNSMLFQIAPLLMIFGFTSTVCFAIYSKYGMNIFLPDTMKRLSLTSKDWQVKLAKSTVVMIGGPHRGGTTVLWEQLRCHPEISSFGTTKESGVDYSEGVFLQSVYPRFGVGNEYQHLSTPLKSGTERHDGLGRYGLDPASHMTDEHSLVSRDNQAELLNAFGYYWKDLDEAKVLLEKSPSNLHIGRFLQALLNLGTGTATDLMAEASRSEHQRKSVVKFVFISRHPIANALAHRALPECAHLSIEDLVEHWVLVRAFSAAVDHICATAVFLARHFPSLDSQVHEYAEADSPYLVHLKRLTLESFTSDPGSHLLDVWEWLGLNVSKGIELAAEARAAVRKDPNAK